MRKLIIGAITASAIAGGSVALALTNPLGIAGAQSNGTAPGTTQPAPSTGSTPTPANPGGPGAKGGPSTGGFHGRGPRGGAGGGALEQTLKDLVANGTITQAQADAIQNGVKAKIGSEMGGHGGPAAGMFKDYLETAAGAIGIDTKTLLTELKDGKSIAAVAQAHGVDPQKVIDAIVAKATADIDKAVADGKLTADRAAKVKADLADRITKLVNATHTGRGPKGFGGAPGAPGTTEPPTTEPGATTTEPPSTTAPTTTPSTTSAPATTTAPSTAPGTTPTTVS